MFRSYRAKASNFTSGVNSTFDGGFYFDGTMMHVETIVQAASTATYPMGSGPLIKAPTEMARYSHVNAYLGDKTLGVGLAHNAATGATYPVVAIQRNSWQVEIVAAVGGPYQQITGAVPFVWGPYSGFRIDWSYRPKIDSVPKNFTAYGDSIVRFESNSLTDTITWPNHVPVDGLVFGGGYAVDSGTSAQVLAGAKKIYANAGVVGVGVNDIAQSVPQATTLTNVTALAAKIQADNFILCKIAPYNANPTTANALNDAYATLGATNGWAVIDPFAAYRNPDGTWVTGASSDGVHPVLAVQQAAALVIRSAILAL